MKYLLILPFLLFTLALGAQSENTRFNEIELDGRYSFRVRVEEGDLDKLVSAYAAASGDGTAAGFRGAKESTTDSDVKIAIDTERRDVSVSYKGENEGTLRAAKARAVIIREALSAPATPATPKKN